MIPANLRNRLSLDPEMKKCLECKQPPQWHHVISGMGRKQISEWWSIAPLCKLHHQDKPTKEIMRKALKWCLNRASDEDLAKYPKHNLIKERELLNNNKR